MCPTSSAPAVAAAATPTAFNGVSAKRASIDASSVAAEDAPESDRKEPNEAEEAGLTAIELEAERRKKRASGFGFGDEEKLDEEAIENYYR